jgi:hypothetical protein
VRSQLTRITGHKPLERSLAKPSRTYVEVVVSWVTSSLQLAYWCLWSHRLRPARASQCARPTTTPLTRAGSRLAKSKNF